MVFQGNAREDDKKSGSAASKVKVLQICLESRA